MCLRQVCLSAEYIDREVSMGTNPEIRLVGIGTYLAFRDRLPEGNQEKSWKQCFMHEETLVGLPNTTERILAKFVGKVICGTYGEKLGFRA